MTDSNWKLVEKYLEEAHAKLKAAEYLFNGKFYNDSISRAYYAMFNAAKAALAWKI